MDNSNMPEICKSCPYVNYIKYDANYETNSLLNCFYPKCPHEQNQIEDTRDGQTYGDF
jgi:hypothetical protein